MESMHVPRIVLAGVSSGVGKTTIVTGLTALLHAMGLSVQPFKVGPDYIDPGFHAKAAGRDSYNLDTWLVPEDRLVSTFLALAGGADVSVIEGVMGLYDGGDNGISSTAQIAKFLRAPVILVINCQSIGTSAAAIALGYKNYDPELNIAGVILNKLGSDKHEMMIREAMAEIGIPVLGAYHRDAGLETPERHLGLTPVTEIETSLLLSKMKEDAKKFLDIDSILHIARSAEELTMQEEKETLSLHHVRIGVAQDAAFTFYYPTSLNALSRRGAELVPFSPMTDSGLPEVDGLIFGGGFPEMFLAELSGNAAMKAAIRRAADKGMPIYAECGGLMYLCRQIVGFENETYDMAGLVPAVCRMQKKLQRVGYVTAKPIRKSVAACPGDTLRGHEFHFSILESDISDFPWAYDLQGTRQSESHKEGYAKENVLASYFHMNFDGNPIAADRFISACAAYREKR